MGRAPASDAADPDAGVPPPSPRLCAPVNKNGEDPTAPTHPEHLLCYKVRRTDFDGFSVSVNNQFGPRQLELIRRRVLRTVPPERGIYHEHHDDEHHDHHPELPVARVPPADRAMTLVGSQRPSTGACGAAPQANAGPDQMTQTLIAITVSGAGSSDSDGTITGYAWAFGDGATASGPSVSHAYATAGTYNVTLTVTDNTGLRDTDTATVSVANRAPVANAGPVPAPAMTVSLSGAGSRDPDGTITSYQWRSATVRRRAAWP